MIFKIFLDGKYYFQKYITLMLIRDNLKRKINIIFFMKIFQKKRQNEYLSYKKPITIYSKISFTFKIDYKNEKFDREKKFFKHFCNTKFYFFRLLKFLIFDFLLFRPITANPERERLKISVIKYILYYYS